MEKLHQGTLEEASEMAAIDKYKISQLQNGNEEYSVKAQEQHEYEMEISREAFTEGAAWIVKTLNL